MADEETPAENETEAVEEQAEETAAPEAQATEAPEAEAAAEEPEAQAPAAEESPAEEAPEEPAEPEAAAEEPAAEEATPEPEAAADEAPAAAPAPKAEKPAPVTAPHPKELRKQRRGTHTGDAKPPRTIEERVAEREAERAIKTKHRRARRAKERANKTGTPGPAKTPRVVVEKNTGKRIREGIVVSDKADKTITVQIDSARRHPRYEKILRRSTKLYAHDEQNEANVGDTVRVIESRPLSRSKRWRLTDVLERSR